MFEKKGGRGEGSTKVRIKEIQVASREKERKTKGKIPEQRRLGEASFSKNRRSGTGGPWGLERATHIQMFQILDRTGQERIGPSIPRMLGRKQEKEKEKDWWVGWWCLIAWLIDIRRLAAEKSLMVSDGQWLSLTSLLLWISSRVASFLWFFPASIPCVASPSIEPFNSFLNLVRLDSDSIGIFDTPHH